METLFSLRSLLVLRVFARRVWRGSRPLALVSLGAAALLAVSLVLQLVDPRVLAGASVWMKPAKFGASIAITGPVLAWIIDQLDPARRRRHAVAGAVVAGVAALELAIITLQAARGVPSHFNASTPLDTALFATMGAAISILWLAEVALALAAFRQRFATPARTWAIRLGLTGTLLGGAIGFVMTRPTPAQVASLQAGRPTPAVGAHAVGVRDGGPGLPMTRWSTVGGDLRVPHFFGLHALQALPLLAVWLERRRRPSSGRIVVAAGAGWIGLTAVTLWQALRGQPLIAPDAATVAAALAVLLATVALAAVSRSRAPAREDGGEALDVVVGV